MSISSSAIMPIPERFRGLRVLLIENDITLQEQLAKLLRTNSYQVTTATRVSAGLFMILNDCIYNGVLINADISDVDITTFLHKALKHSPQLSIILMVSVNNYWNLPNEALRNNSVLCILKPCELGNICEIWKHISRRRISHQENGSNGELHVENQVSNVSSGTDIHQDLDNKSQDRVANKEPVTYESLFRDDDEEQVDEIAVQENLGSGTTDKGDKRKKAVEHDKPGKRTCITWTKELNAKFLEALNALGNKQADASLILKIMNVPGLTCTQVENHLQNHLETVKSDEKFQTSMLAHIKKRDMLQLASNVCKRRGYYTPPNNLASINESSNSLFRPWNQPNLTGISYTTKSTPLPVSQLTTTTTMNNFGNNLATAHNFGGPSRPLIGNFGMVTSFNNGTFRNDASGIGPSKVHVEGNSGMVNNSTSFNNGTFGNDASGIGPSKVHVPLNRFGIATEPWVAGCGNNEGSSNHSQESLQVNQENLFLKFPVLSAALSKNKSRFSSSVSFGDVSTGFCGPIFPVEENRNHSQTQPQPPVSSTTVIMNSSQGEFVNNDLIPNRSHCEPLVNSTSVPLESWQDDSINDDLIPNLLSHYEPPVRYILPPDSLQGERIDDDSVQNLSQFDIHECIDLLNS